MCGFSGFLGFSSLNEDHFIPILKDMNYQLSHRGPDKEGFWYDSTRQIALGHRRLSIIDLSDAGNQPMTAQSGNYIIAFNGEIYNHLKLRKLIELEKKEMSWIGYSDTETLLEAIEHWGLEAALKKTEGMFAFALWSIQDNCLFLARDRFGEKPIYYSWTGSGAEKSFIFSSELKALKKHPHFNHDISRDSIALQMRLSCIPAPYSIYKDTYKLEPGTILRVSLQGRKTNKIRYWSIEDAYLNGINQPFKGDFIEASNFLEKLLIDKVKDQMQSDVPLGAFLSGGVDSSMIVALMQSQSQEKIKTFTIGFDSKGYNEAEHARRIAAYLGTDHNELYVSSHEAINVIPEIPRIYDEPFSDSSQIPTYLVSKLARERVTVSLSGDGGDEIFGGYNRYIFASKYLEIMFNIPLRFRKAFFFFLTKLPYSVINNLSEIINFEDKISNIESKVSKILKALPLKNREQVYLSLLSNWNNPNELVHRSNETKILNSKDLFKEQDIVSYMMMNDSQLYLPDDILTKVDRASMSVSLESRVPYLNHEILNFLSTLPINFKVNKGKSKLLLREVLYRYVPKNLIERPKVGFAVPIQSWLRNDLKEWASDLLNENTLKQQNYLDSELVTRTFKEHLEGRDNHDQKLWDVLMFQAWLNDQ